MPRGPRARSEMNSTHAYPRWLLASRNDVEPHIAGEPVRWAFGCRLLWSNLHSPLLLFNRVSRATHPRPKWLVSTVDVAVDPRSPRRRSFSSSQVSACGGGPWSVPRLRSQHRSLDGQRTMAGDSGCIRASRRPLVCTRLLSARRRSRADPPLEEL